MIENDFATESKIEEIPTVSIAVGETSGVSAGTRVVVNHNASDPNQHTIGAITGLRTELDAIEELKPVYSNKLGVANYYTCIDGQYDDYGYFVSLVSADSVKKCNGNNNDAIFGVTVDSAAFIGGQVNGTTTNPIIDNSKVLVATDGLVTVRCESDVAVGDFVVSNVDGIARKTETVSGYKVAAINTSNDNITYASIILGVQADVTDKISASVTDLDSRLQAAETTVLSAINLADRAIRELEDIDTSKLVTSDKIEAIEGAANDAVSKADGALSDAINASILATQAKEIANSAITSAEAAKNEAIAEANKAMEESQALRAELSNTAQAMQGNLDNTVLKFNSLADKLTPLAEWGDGKGIAGFVARADEDAAILASVTKLEGNFGTAIAGFVSNATSENSEIQALASYKYKDVNGKEHTSVAALDAFAKDNQASIDLIAGVDGSIAGLQAQVDETKSQVDIVSQKVATKYEVVESFDVADQTKHNVVYYAQDTKQYHYFENNEWKETSDPADAPLPVALAGVKVKTDENSSSINSMAEWQGTTKNTMARLEQKADENGAYIQSTVANMDKYAVGPHSQAYGFTLEQAASILEDGMMYAPIGDMTIANGKAETYSYTENEEKKTYTQEFLESYIYRWSNIEGVYKWIPVDKNYTEGETNTSGPSVYFTAEEPDTVDTTHGYWYKTSAKDADGNVIESEYEPYVLYKWMEEATVYKWVPVATLAGNAKSRAISQIRQDTDRISASITDINGSVAGIQAELSPIKSQVQTIADWQGTTGNSLSTFMNEAGDRFASAAQVASIVDKEGNVKESAIVAAVNNNASSITLMADYVLFKKEVEGDINSTVASSRIEYARSSSATTFVKTTEWSTTAPPWTSDEYMWQRIITIKKDNTEIESQPVCIQGARGTDGTGVAIKGTAYVKDVTIDDSIIGNEYPIYKDAQCTEQITTIQDGDAYLANGYLFVYSGKDYKFTCAGKIKGKDGVTPTIEISEDGYWIINGTKTDIKARGDNGTHAPTIVKTTKQYYLSTSNESLVEGSWSTTPADFTKGSYMWTRYEYTMSDESKIYSDATLDNTFTTISAWCQESNTTLIDGANIATGTIKASDITTGTLESHEYAYESGVYSTNGTAIDLDTGSVRSMNFAIDENGDAHFKGHIETDSLSAISSNLGTVTSGEIKSPNYGSSNMSIWWNDSIDLEYAISDDETYYVVNGIGTYTGCDLVIPSVYDGLPVKEIAASAFHQNTTITKLVIPNSIVTIGDSAFGGCSNLAEIRFNATSMNDRDASMYAPFANAGKNGDGIMVIIGANVTRIPAYLFTSIFFGTTPNTPKITSVTFESGSVCNSIGAFAFSQCQSLTSIVIPESIKTIENSAFYNCTALSEIQFNATEMNNLNSYNNVFSDAGTNGDGIKVIIGENVTIIPSKLFDPDTDTRGVPNITEMHIPSSVTTIRYFIPYSYTGISNVYYGGTENEWNAIEIDSSNHPLINATRYYYSENEPTTPGNYWRYSDCNGFKISCSDQKMIDSKYFTVTQDGVVVAKEGQIGGFTLADGNLTSNYKPLADYIASGTRTFTSPLTYKETKYNDVSGYCVTSKGGGSNDWGGYTESEIIIPDTYNGKPVFSIGYRAFWCCTNLKKITIGNNVKEIDSGAFMGCTGLTSIVIPDSVTHIWNEAFTSSGLQSVHFGPNSQIKSFGAHSFECPKLIEIELPESVRVISDNVFDRCESLERVILGTNIDPTFTSQDSLGQTVKHYGIHPKAFVRCDPSKLKIYYKGTKKEWEENQLTPPEQLIISESESITLTDANLYYYDESGTESGNYWHYNRPSGVCISGKDNIISTKYFNLDAEGVVTAEKATIRGEIAAQTVSAKNIMVSDVLKKTYVGVTADVEYYKDLAVSHDANGTPTLSYSLGKLKFVNGILVEVT